jgi:hypothetical protein
VKQPVAGAARSPESNPLKFKLRRILAQVFLKRGRGTAVCPKMKTGLHRISNSLDRRHVSYP